MRYANAACSMQQQIATMGRHSSESICAVAVRIRMRQIESLDVGQEIQRGDVITDVFPQRSQIVDGISGKVVAFYICLQ